MSIARQNYQIGPSFVGNKYFFNKACYWKEFRENIFRRVLMQEVI